MASKIQWQIEFQGLDVALSKLREIDRILARIASHTGGIFIDQSNKTSGPDGTHNAHGVGAGSSAAGTVGAASGIAELEKQNKSILEHFFTGGSVKNYSTPTAKESWGPKVNGPMSLKPFPESVVSPKSRWQDAFNPAKIMEEMKGKVTGIKQTFAFEGFFAGMKALKGAFLAFSVITLIVTMALKGLKDIVEVLSIGIKHAAEEYQRAAETGMDIRKSSALEQAMKAVGVGGTPTYHMAGQTSAGGVISAARATGFGGAQQLQNMSKEFAAALKDGSAAARQMELSAKSGMLLNMDGIALSRELKTMWALLAANLQPLLHGFMQFMINMVKVINLWLEFLLKIKTFLGLVPTGEPGKARWPSGGAGGGGMPAITSWEKIGFKFGSASGGPTQALQDIRGNTKESNKWLEMISNGIALMLRLNPSTAGAAQFLP